MQATLEIAERISTISVSSTMKVAADADKLRREGVDVVDFGAGEPDFPTPDNIKNAALPPWMRTSPSTRRRVERKSCGTPSANATKLISAPTTRYRNRW